ncbi:MAG: choice-of-anchor L domain-containing protein [Acidimicrobiia bacterium]|nr:choice-of-anchor L domain-containing protein [Acidimicrobiia bacterium]
MGIVIGVAVAAFLTFGLKAAAATLSAQDLNQAGMSPQVLVNSLLGSGVTASNVTFTGSNCGGGLFSGGTGTIGFDTGVVLGSGSVQSGDTQCNGQKGIEGPNSADDNTGNNGTPGDTQLSQLAGQTANPPQASATTYDAAALEFDFVPSGSQLNFNYVFSSEEYNEFVNSEFNDVFGFFVNGQNCALVPGTTAPVTINSVNGGNPFGTSADNAQFYRNNDPNDPGPPAIDTEMDGLTTVFTCQATVNPGVTNHIKMAIADTGDSAYDSNVFIQGGTFSAPTTTTTVASTTTTTTVPSTTTTTTVPGTTTTTTVPSTTTTTTTADTTTVPSTTPLATTTTTVPSTTTTAAPGAGPGGTSSTTAPQATQSQGQSSASSPAPGQSITITGTGFAPNQPVTITATNPPTSLGTATSDPAGHVQAQVVVPVNAAPGPEQIVITGPAPGGGTHQVVVSFTIAATAPVATPAVAEPSFTG